jgi:hypothetical protein
MTLRRLLPASVFVIAIALVVMFMNGNTADAQSQGAPVRVIAPLPLPVTVDETAKTPVQVRVTGASNTPVPADQNLTIEFVSLLCRSTSTATAGTFVTLFTQIGTGDLIEHPLFADFMKPGGGENFYVGSHPVRIYASAGTTVTVLSSVDQSCAVTISGFLSPA